MTEGAFLCLYGYRNYQPRLSRPWTTNLDGSNYGRRNRWAQCIA